MNTVLIILGIFFSIVATIIGIFITPFLSWLTNFEMYIVILVIGAILLLISILLPIIKRKAKWAVAILVAIPIFISGLVSTIKFGGNIHAKDDYLINDYGVYNMFGIEIIGDEGRKLIAYNKYGEKFIICWEYKEVEDGIYDQPRLDSDGRRVYDNNGYAVYDECTNYNIHGQIRIYNSDGILLEKEKNPYLFGYYKNGHSAYDYKYQYSGVDAEYVGGQYFVNGKPYSTENIAEAEVIKWIEISRDYIVQE
ncbi:MAG: hypothetical protein E7143_03770 [Rikenellaceae bacterium]|nr:hypothetical protein [Rikenellaceae bacterium]